MQPVHTTGGQPLKPYVYVLVRTDISWEQQLVQVSHAAREGGALYPCKGETASIVMMSVRDSRALEEAADRLTRHGIEHHMFFEPDFGMGHSAIATRPLRQMSERHLMRKYPMYRLSPLG